MNIYTINADITTLSCDAVVNSSNYDLSSGSPHSVNHAIHKAAGPKLDIACKRIATCPIGEARITSAFDMPCKYIIHTVSPVWYGGSSGESRLLTSCYVNSLKLATDNGIRSIVFPSIGTGNLLFPSALAAEIAINAVMSFLKKSPDAFDEIVWCFKDKGTRNLYKAAITAFIPEEYKVKMKHPAVFVVSGIDTEIAAFDEKKSNIEISVQDADTAILRFCEKYLILLELIEKDKELQKWCEEYRKDYIYYPHEALKDILQYRMCSDARHAGFISGKCKAILAKHQLNGGCFARMRADEISNLSTDVLKAALAWQFIEDEREEGLLIREGVAGGTLLKLMREICVRFGM